jgi:carbon storage regulator
MNLAKPGETKDLTTMLVLSRKLNESIVIGDKITLTVVKIDRNCVRLGIDAPQDVTIFRQELLDKSMEPASEPVRNGSVHES